MRKGRVGMYGYSASNDLLKGHPITYCDHDMDAHAVFSLYEDGLKFRGWKQEMPEEEVWNAHANVGQFTKNGATMYVFFNTEDEHYEP
jgi:hypothetical protein